jgi:predicted alpha/beta superfamily hydrolase
MSRRTLILFVCFLSIPAAAQDFAPPAPQRLVVHSNVLNEDRVILVRTPAAAQRGKSRYAVLYLTDGDGHINEIGSTIDFLVNNDRMPPLIVVGITNTDRTRDLTPTSWPMAPNEKPVGGGADKFLDFIQTELVPEIDKRYPTEPYRVFAGHSLGGLLAIHALITRPDLFHAYIAVSPSLQWDDGRVLHQAQEFFAKQKEYRKALYTSLANEGDRPGPMGANFEQLQKTLNGNLPKGFTAKSERYHDEDHGSTVLRAHYAGLRTIFADWQMPRDPTNGMPSGGLKGIELHSQELSDRYGFRVSAESKINQLGYAFLGMKKVGEAIAAFKRNVELYPSSANVYDSLGDGYEAAGKLDLAMENTRKAVATGEQNGDPELAAFKKHLDRLTAADKAGSGKSTQEK